MVLNDMKLDPFILVQKLLGMFFSGVQKIRYEDFDNFIRRFETYFNEPDLDLFLREVKMLERGEDETIDINEIASMIKNDIEMMPR